MRRRMSGSFSSSIKGPVFVILACASGPPNRSNNNRDEHGKDDDTDGPTVDELVIPLILFRLINNFWCEITWRPTHCLQTAHIKNLSIQGRVNEARQYRTFSM